ncbi:hypothetical protein OE766_18125 [Pararhizobium sp. YC-54]|uniref:hypothetical protein n=1 Tax=Pararhizobium sp. YC-54 TaxID=2986920 RepID=UPI0021F72080|nr:hypothetical protein [Pararhizobium sp. YC-54]MCW0000154.1 hypothetical protein [Pararhizobium sp. YC-54]
MRAAVESALIHAEKIDCRLIVSDNSGDAAKKACFENCSDRLTYIVPEGDDPAVNVMTALLPGLSVRYVNFYNTTASMAA